MGEISLDRGCPTARRSPDRIENRASRSARTRAVQSILVDRIDRDCCLSVHATHWPNERSRTTSLRWIKLSHRRSVSHWSDRDFSSDASFDARNREFVNRLCCGIEFDHFASSEFLVADRLGAGRVLFRLHLATLRWEGERPARHSRLLLVL